MIRRQFIKALGALPLIPLVVKDEEVGKIIQINPNAKYIVLVKASSRFAHTENLEEFCKSDNGLPIGTPVFVVDDPEEDIKILKL